MEQTRIKSVSISPVWSQIAKKNDISLSKALKDGIALNLSLLNPDFPDTDIEHALYNDSKLGVFKTQIAAKIQEIYK